MRAGTSALVTGGAGGAGAAAGGIAASGKSCQEIDNTNLQAVYKRRSQSKCLLHS